MIPRATFVRFALLLLCGIIVPLSAEAETLRLRRFVLLAGTNDGGPDRVPLRYANTDARAFGKVLDELGGVDKADRALLTDATRTSLEEAFKSMKDRLEKTTVPGVRTEAVFYYSGHSDETGLLLGKERVTYPELRQWLSTLGADVRIAILDSCASGTLARQKGGTRVPAFLVDSSSQIHGQAILTSSSADEASQESDRIGGSFFTHHLVSGLRGAADATADGRVTLNEAYQFAFHETLARTEQTRGGPQHPAYDMELAGAGDLVLTDLRATSASLALEAPLDGRLYIRDADGTLVVELRKPVGRPTTIGLAPGHYSVVRDVDGKSSRAEFDVGEGQRTSLSLARFADAPSELTVSRGGPQISVAYRTFNVAVAPGVSTNDIIDGPVENAVALSLAGAESYRLRGFGFSFGFNWVETDARGPLLSLGLNRAGGNSTFNTTVGVNVTQGNSAANLSVASNWTEGRSYFDATAGLNRTGSLRGVQLAAGANVLTEGGSGFQAAAGSNIVTGPFVGAQMSSGLSFAQMIRGAQISVVNVGGSVDGTQIGVVNIARDVKGFQLGVVNLAENVSGASVGVLSLVRNGRWNASVYASDWAYANGELKLGSDRVYTFFAAGRGERSSRDFRSLGAGLGVHFFPLNALTVDVDAGFHSLYAQGRGWNSRAGIAQARATAAYSLMKRFALFAGPTYNVGFELNDGSGFDSVSRFASKQKKDVAQWPGVVLGIQL